MTSATTHNTESTTAYFDKWSGVLGLNVIVAVLIAILLVFPGPQSAYIAVTFICFFLELLAYFSHNLRIKWDGSTFTHYGNLLRHDTVNLSAVTKLQAIPKNRTTFIRITDSYGHKAEFRQAMEKRELWGPYLAYRAKLCGVEMSKTTLRSLGAGHLDLATYDPSLSFELPAKICTNSSWRVPSKVLPPKHTYGTYLPPLVAAFAAGFFFPTASGPLGGIAVLTWWRTRQRIWLRKNNLFSKSYGQVGLEKLPNSQITKIWVDEDPDTSTILVAQTRTGYTQTLAAGKANAYTKSEFNKIARQLNYLLRLDELQPDEL